MLAPFMQNWSRAKCRPRAAAGMSSMIHGSHAQLAMPRMVLKTKSSASTSTSRVGASRNPLVSGTAAMRNTTPTRALHPLSTNRR